MRLLHDPETLLGASWSVRLDAASLSVGMAVIDKEIHRRRSPLKETLLHVRPSDVLTHHLEARVPEHLLESE